ncbi:hypothetical protein C1645_732474 [Glomus cerebriforme]|uniref:3CxxC-type domain-containing protein n=1 Tax=Glomus cerebriforme TaxID=658196 RepID=A0A397TH65_9GLOM|nr:hypothetical protein C1645_732474 [Glomus cerebriforme]
MFNVKFRFPVLFLLTRRIRFFQQTFERKLVTTPLLLQGKKVQNNSEKKIENKETTFQKGEKRTYYKYICKCKTGFNTFQEFLDHVKSLHQIKNLNFTEILEKRNGFEREITFYWNLSCQCGNKFSSSLCCARLKVNNGKIEILKKYRLHCLKCKRSAQFDKEKLLDEFLRERIKQKLIYNFYKKIFDQFDYEPSGGKVLEGHIPELCEKCQSHGGHQEQINLFRRPFILKPKSNYH